MAAIASNVTFNSEQRAVIIIPAAVESPSEVRPSLKLLDFISKVLTVSEQSSYRNLAFPPEKTGSPFP